MSQDSWLVLGLASRLFGRDADALLARFGKADAIVGSSASALQSAGLSARTVRDLTQPDERGLEHCREWLETGGHTAITWNDPTYPPMLRDIYDAPVLLFVRGDVDVLSLPQFAIVGSRNATPGGCETAQRFAAHLGAAGFCITSGLAAGIDSAAHRGALAANARTIAVCATGPDLVYPTQHTELADDIARQGAIVTEFPPGTPPRRAQFPQRNRLISGMSVGTLVVEASRRSGALITARLASEQGREVFAVPGSIHNPTARGCHQLIRSGAKLVESSADIVEELPGILAGIGEFIEQNTAETQADTSHVDDSDYQRLLTFMGWDPMSVDALVHRSGLTAEEVSSMLLILELEGRVGLLAGGAYIQREKGRLK